MERPRRAKKVPVRFCEVQVHSDEGDGEDTSIWPAEEQGDEDAVQEGTRDRGKAMGKRKRKQEERRNPRDSVAQRNATTKKQQRRARKEGAKRNQDHQATEMQDGGATFSPSPLPEEVVRRIAKEALSRRFPEEQDFCPNFLVAERARAHAQKSPEPWRKLGIAVIAEMAGGAQAKEREELVAGVMPAWKWQSIQASGHVIYVKTSLKSMLKLSDADMDLLTPVKVQRNPHDRYGPPMKKYELRKAIEVAWRKHGSLATFERKCDQARRRSLSAHARRGTEAAPRLPFRQRQARLMERSVPRGDALAESAVPADFYVPPDDGPPPDEISDDDYERECNCPCAQQ